MIETLPSVASLSHAFSPLICLTTLTSWCYYPLPQSRCWGSERFSDEIALLIRFAVGFESLVFWLLESSHVIAGSSSHSRSQVNPRMLHYGPVTQRSQPSPSHSVFHRSLGWKGEPSEEPCGCCFLVQPTFSYYMSQQSFFWVFRGEAAASGPCGSSWSLWWAHVAAGTVQPPAFLRQRWNPRDEEPLCSVTSWWNKAALRFLIPASLKSEMKGVLPVCQQLTTPGEHIHLPGPHFLVKWRSDSCVVLTDVAGPSTDWESCLNKAKLPFMLRISKHLKMSN